MSRSLSAFGRAMQPRRPILDREGGSLQLDANVTNRPYNKTLKCTLAGKARIGERYIGPCVAPAVRVITIKVIVGETHMVADIISC